MSKPLLQIALDKREMTEALEPLQKASAEIDIIEVGTVLLLAEGVHAVRTIRALFPDKPILADLRIAEAGKVLSQIAFDAGASLVSVVAGASLATVSQVCQVAEAAGGAVQIELADEWFDLERARSWRELGAQHVIVKRSRDREASGDLSWKSEDMARITELSKLGFKVTITGGITPHDLDAFADQPVGIVIAGRSIVDADDPLVAAAQFQEALGRVWAS